MSATWQANIYKINNDGEITSNILKELIKNDYYKSQKELLRLLITEKPKYIEQPLIKKEIGDFQIFLYYKKSRKGNPDWKNFITDTVVKTAIIHVNAVSEHESFVMFFFNKITKNLYSICGGHGIFTIQEHTEDDFGINILSRIVTNKNKKVIAHAKELGVTGGILGVIKHFRQNFDFYENDNFANVYREITTHLDSKTIKKLGLSIEKDKKSLCLAKSSFRINKAIPFTSLMNIIMKCDYIIENESVKIEVNNIKLIDNKKSSALITKLNIKLMRKLLSVKRNLSLTNDFDLTHKDFNKFLTAVKFEFNATKLSSKDTLLFDIINSISSLGRIDYKTRLKNAILTSFDENGDELTKGKFLDHLILELEYDKKFYFFINGKWFVINANFTKELNVSCSSFIKDNRNKMLRKKWGEIRESVYNLKYKGDAKTIVLDTITPEGVEVCDVLKYNDNTTYLFHIKKGFNGSMRDLCSQVFTSANRVAQDKVDDFNYLKEIYKRMEASTTYKGQIADEETFLNLFSNNKLIFVLAVSDQATTTRDIKDISKFKSNIAKFSLRELIEKMNIKGFNFEVAQIK